MKNQNENNPYADIIDLPHHVSKKYPQMPIAKRAAQFSPFAALSGHGTAIREATRITEEKKILGEDMKDILDWKINALRERLHEKPEIAITHFIPDTRKEGGAYVTTVGCLEKIDSRNGLFVLDDGSQICFDDVYDISGESIDCF